jgi:hypothetical protein
MDTVAAFRFSDVDASYAARTTGDRNVGAIGVAFFREQPPVVWRPTPRPTAPSASGAGGRSGAPAPSRSAEPSDRRAGLGTRFGESHESHVGETIFVRADATPAAVSEIRYDDRAGLRAMGIPVGPAPRDAELRATAEPFPREGRFAQPPP